MFNLCEAHMSEDDLLRQLAIYKQAEQLLLKLLKEANDVLAESKRRLSHSVFSDTEQLPFDYQP